MLMDKKEFQVGTGKRNCWRLEVENGKIDKKITYISRHKCRMSEKICIIFVVEGTQWRHMEHL